MVHYRNHRADARQARERMEEVGESITYADVELRRNVPHGTMFSDLNIVDSATQWSLSYLDRKADYDSDPDSENEPDFNCYPDSE